MRQRDSKYRDDELAAVVAFLRLRARLLREAAAAIVGLDVHEGITRPLAARMDAEDEALVTAAQALENKEHRT